MNLPEHAAPQPDESTSGDVYQPTEDERKNIRLVEKLFDRHKRAKGRYDEKWNDFYNMYRGRQWKEKRPSYRHSEVINLIFREIQSVVPLLTDTKPRFEFLPQEPSDFELSDILNQVAESDWIKYNWSYQLAENLYDSNILGTGLGGMDFDPKLEGGLGAITYDSEDPFYHFPSPSAKNVNDGSKAYIKAEPMDLDEIKCRWPNGKFVKADMVNIKKMDIFDKNRVRVASPVDATVWADKSEQYDKDNSPQALVISLYLSGDYEIEESPQDTESDDGLSVTQFVQKKKYPNGRVVVIASGVCLEDKPEPYDDGRFPFARLQNYINQRQFWGISDVEQLESPQKIFNKLICFSLDVLTLMGNPIWVVGTGSGVDTDNLFNQPGLVVEADDINALRREEGVQLQPYVLQLIDRMKVWFDDVSGSSDVSRGQKPEGITAASAIQSLQEATLTRIRQKSKNLDSYLQEMGQLYLSRVFQFYTAPRIFRLTQKDGSNKFFKFHVEDVLDQNNEPTDQKVVHFTPYTQGQDGQFYDGETTVKPISGLFDVKVSTGSNLPFAKAEKEQRLFNLYDRQIIDGEEVLKNLDYPNWEAVMQRMQERAQSQAQQQPPPPQH